MGVNEVVRRPATRKRNRLRELGRETEHAYCAHEYRAEIKYV